MLITNYKFVTTYKITTIHCKNESFRYSAITQEESIRYSAITQQESNLGIPVVSIYYTKFTKEINTHTMFNQGLKKSKDSMAREPLQCCLTGM